MCSYLSSTNKDTHIGLKPVAISIKFAKFTFHRFITRKLNACIFKLVTWICFDKYFSLHTSLKFSIFLYLSTWHPLTIFKVCNDKHIEEIFVLVDRYRILQIMLCKAAL